MDLRVTGNLAYKTICLCRSLSSKICHVCGKNILERSIKAEHTCLGLFTRSVSRYVGELMATNENIFSPVFSVGGEQSPHRSRELSCFAIVCGHPGIQCVASPHPHIQRGGGGRMALCITRPPTRKHGFNGARHKQGEKKPQ